MDKTTDDVRFMNIAKALGISAVVIGHSGSPLAPYVYLYHLSLFYFISGYFFRDEYVRSPLLLLKKRLKSLYLPYISYQFFFLALHNVFLKTGIYSPRWDHAYSMSDYFSSAGGILLFFSNSEHMAMMLWFLSSIFFVNILFCLVRLAGTYIGRVEPFTVFGVLLIFSFGFRASYKTSYVLLIFNIVCVGLSMYYAGYLFRRIEQRVIMHWVPAAAAAALLAAAARHGNINFAANKFGTVWLFFAGSFLGIYANIYLAKRLAATGAGLLDYMGKNTVVIMAMHPLAFKAVHLVQISHNSYPLDYLAYFPVLDGSSGWWIAYCISGIFIPAAVKYYLGMGVGVVEKIWAKLRAQIRHENNT